MSNTTSHPLSQTKTDKHVVSIPIEEDLICLKCMSPRKLRFEIEYALEKGTTANAFLFTQINETNSSAVLVHPPGINFEEVFIAELINIISHKDTNLLVVIGHINPNRVALLKKLAEIFNHIEFVASNPAAKLLKDLWYQVKPSQLRNNEESNTIIPPLPNIKLIKQEQTIALFNEYEMQLIPSPTARWPGGLISFERKLGLLMSDKLFGAHLCNDLWAEPNRSSTEEERRHYFDCLMSPMISQVSSIIEKLEDLDIQTIAPGHGPAIETSWRSLLNDYQRWGEGQQKASLKVVLLFASAYGNTASIADSLAKGINSTGVKVDSLNCEFTPANELVQAIKEADAYLIGSPTLGGHAPTPIVAALGTLLAEGDRQKPVGIFGSYGWSGEALDLLENKLRDGGFEFGFNPIKIKFSPNNNIIKTLEETGTQFGRQLLKEQRRKKRRLGGGISTTKSDPALLALGKVIGSLCILTAFKNTEEESLSGAMVASWVSQASFNPPGITIAVAKDRAVETLLHKEDLFALNILNEENYHKLLKQFLQPFKPGADRFKGIQVDQSPGKQPILPEALAWLEGSVQQRMECGDHWLIYAQIHHGKVLSSDGVTAVHHRNTGANY
ncbi:diflavin flavoprotein [Prochlorococcus marinus]|uniref:Flavoprotein n=1 Tax=Prochlorococcus marinus (strain MIT 9211) TaxID=93059 RepID=A9B9E1_PROM4|nr:diflavin flavoprotein [Prochlorococcus marinus]ABX07978.1 flavoprotein [Prochlorococcus marinus str. MIT 9211]